MVESKRDEIMTRWTVSFFKKRVMDKVIERGKTGSGNGLSLHSHAVAEAKGNSKFRQGYRRRENVGERTK